MQQFSHWIDGAERSPSAGQWIDTVNPFTNKPWAQIARGNAADADAAVQAAKRAMTTGPWAKMSPTQRGKILLRIADLLRANIERLGAIEVRDNGKLLADLSGQLNFAADLWQFYAGLADKIEGSVPAIEKPEMLAMTWREPVGVVVAITAWNTPVGFFTQKCAPALAAGCSVVVKPSEFSSVSSIEFVKLTKEAGLPDGVINVVTGFGHEVGTALIEHPKVSKISFTGSAGTGARIYQAAARDMKRVALELGGKSPNIVFEDADLDAAVPGAVAGIFGASGQMCTAGSRLLVQNSVKEEFTRRILETARTIKLGDPMSPDTQMGPMSTRPQYEKVLEYIKIANEEGARCIAGGKPAQGPGLEGGQFVEPTIYTDVTNDMRIAREEVFGPILSIIGFDDEEEAIRIANDTDYGLAAAVWTANIGRLVRVAKALETGKVWGNVYRAYSMTTPGGGRKMSGIGREFGIEAIDEFLETKTVMISIAQSASGNAFVAK